MNGKKVWFITGSSTGIGRELAEEALNQGYKVVATARKPEVLADLIERHPQNAKVVSLDVTKPEQVRAALKTAIDTFSKIDVLVNNAAYGFVGSIEEADNAEIRQQFETNVFGALDVMRAALPILRKQRSGHILNVSSFVGLVSLASFGYTSATKFTLEAFSEALAQEVAHLGIKVTIVEPGLFRTNFNSDNSLFAARNRIADYPSTEKTLEMLRGMDGKQPNDPKKAARAMIQIVESENPPLRLPLGIDFFQMVQGKLDLMHKDFEEWRTLTVSTGFDD